MKPVFRLAFWIAAVAVLMTSSVLRDEVSFHVAWASPHPQSASPVSCVGLDVVFLIDQSDSMSVTSRPADPTEQRRYAVEAVIDQLADVALDQCPATSHRIAVISYGTEAEIDLPLSLIDPDTFDEAQRIREALKSKVTARQMDQTNPKAAFALAAEILNNAPPLSGDAIRKRVIIFITDGVPCTEEIGCGTPYLLWQQYAVELQEQVDEAFPFDTNLLKQEACLAELRANYDDVQAAPPDKVNACLALSRNPAVYQNSTYLWMILLRSDEFAQARRLGEIYGAMTRARAGEVVQLSQNRQDIPSTFRRILSQLAGVRASLLRCGSFAVNPYLRRATLNMFKLEPELKVTLSYQDVRGTRYTITGGETGPNGGFDVAEYYAYGANERYVFNAPYPGIWQLTADDCDSLDVYYEGVRINPTGYQLNLPLEVPQYDREPFYDAERPFFLEYIMRDETGQIIPQADHPRFAVNVQVTVTDPQGNRLDYPMTWIPAEKLFRGARPLQLPVAGTYTVDIVGTTFEHVGEPRVASENFTEIFNSPRELFRHEKLEFAVFPVAPFAIQILTPTAGETLTPIHGTLIEGWPLPVRPIPVRARIVDHQGQPLTNLSQVLTEPESALTAVITAGDAQSEEVTLRPDPAAPGGYAGEIADFAAEGAQQLRVQLRSSFNERYRPEAHQATVEFRRADGPLNRAATYYAILAALILAMLATIAYNIAIRTNKVAGALVFEDGGVTVAEFWLSSGKNWRDIGRRELSPYPQLELKKLRVENRRRPARGRRGKDESDLLAGDAVMTENSHPGVRVHCVTKDGRAFRLELEPNLPVAYSDEASAHMIYRPPQ